MDLDDLLEDLLENAAKAAKRSARTMVSTTAPGRRKVRRAVRATGLITGAIMLVIGVAMLAVGDPGVLRQIAGGLATFIGLVAAAAGGTAAALEARDPHVKRDKAAAKGTLTPDMLDDDLRELPKDVRGDFRRMLAGRRLVQDLSRDGLIDLPSMLELDGRIARLHGLLVADRRTAELGGRPSADLRAQVGELADLLVAMADEAVAIQAQELSAQPDVSVTLQDAQDHLAALREARQAVEETDRRQRGSAG